MDQVTLVEQNKDGSELVKLLRESGIDVSDAYWLSTDEDDGRYLYLVIPDLERRGIRNTYMQVNDVIGSIRHKHEQSFELAALELLDIKLVDAQDRIASAVDSFRKGQLPDLQKAPASLRKTAIQGQYIKDMFLYPRP